MTTVLKKQGHAVEGCQYETFNPRLLENKHWVVHCGAISSTTFLDRPAIYRKNVLFTEMLAKYCVSLNVGIQFSSSASVYGSHNTTFREEDAPAPGSLYAESKVRAEKVLSAYSKLIPVQIFRYFNVHGYPHEGSKEQPSPFTIFRRQAKERGVIEVFEGSENFKRDFIDVNTLTCTQSKFLDVNNSFTVNMGTGRTMSFLDVAKHVSDQTGCEIVTIPFPEKLRNSYQAYTCASTTNLKKELSRISLELYKSNCY